MSGLSDHLLGAWVAVETWFATVRPGDEEDGQGMVEYALILALVAVVAIAILFILGNQIRNTFNNVTQQLGPAS